MRIYRLSGKTRRDRSKKQYIALYHISPEKLNRLMPRSKLLRTGKIGLYLSTSYKSTIIDWAHYVMNKKHENHPLQKQISALCKKYRELEEQQKVTPAPEIELQMQDIDAKIDKLRETTKTENKAYWESITGYKTLYLHTVLCPLEIYDESQKMMQEVYEADPIKSFGFWNWGAQVFIEAHDLSSLVVKSVDELSIGDLFAKYKNENLNRYVDYPSRLYAKEWERQEAERKKKLEEQAKIPQNPNRYDHKKELERRRKEFEEYWAKNPIKSY